MKRFLTFAGDTYYPQPGWETSRGLYDTQDEAVEALKELHKDEDYDWCHVVDLETEQIVARWRGKTYEPRPDEIYDHTLKRAVKDPLFIKDMPKYRWDCDE